MLNDILLFVAIGFAAQMVDGALGMAYGLTATSVLLSFGTAPAVASASVHAAEVFTTAASGYAHWRLGNVDRSMLWRLAMPGMLGGATGAWVLVTFPGDKLRPIVATYLLLAGLVVLARGLSAKLPSRVEGRTLKAWFTRVLGLTGGCLDAVGGGGWGSLVTSTLIWSGITPRIAIGTVNAAEFFVTTVVATTFLATIGLDLWPVILGLVIGGIVAAPFAALAARHMPDRPLMIIVGVLIVILSLRLLLKVFVP